MKWSYLAGVVGLAVALGGIARAAGTAPDDQYLKAFTSIQEGDAAEQRADWPAAYAKYQGALTILQDIRTNHPDWNPEVLEFRIRYYRDHLQTLIPLLPSQSPEPATATNPAPAPSPSAPTPAPAVSTPGPVAATVPNPSDRVRTLTDALIRAEDRLRELDQVRLALTNQLAAAEKKLADVPKPVPVEETGPWKELEKQLAEARAAREKSDGDLRQTRETFTRLQEELATAHAQIEQSQKTSEQLAALAAQNQDLSNRLAAAQQQLAAVPQPAPAGPTAESKELEKQLADTRAELARTGDDLAKSRTELQQLTNALGEAQSQLDPLRQNAARSEDLARQLDRATNQIAELQERARRQADSLHLTNLRDALMETGAGIGRSTPNQPQ